MRSHRIPSRLAGPCGLNRPRANGTLGSPPSHRNGPRAEATGSRSDLEFFERALERDPGYARAYTGIADCWSTLADDWVHPDDAYPRAKAAAEKALELDPSLAEAVTSIGKVLCWYEWNFAEAERELRRAVTLNENYAEAHYVFGSTLPAVGKLGEAIEQMRRPSPSTRSSRTTAAGSAGS